MARSRAHSNDDYDRLKDAFNELKAKYNKISKENGRLKKELNRASAITFEKELESEVDLVPQVKPKVVDKKKCGKCGSEEVAEIQAGIYLITKCDSCGYRKRREI